MAKIGIMDSGCGGLSVLRELLRVLPGEQYIFYADNANCPYGTKSPEFIISRSREIVAELLSEGAQAIVVACNTATAAAISTLRSEFPDVPFVGMEPAVKPAATGTQTGTIGVLATSGTLRASKYLDTRDHYAGNVRVIEHVGEGYVELVENLELDGDHAREVVEKSLRPLLDEGADVVVLGCTHYPFLRPLMESVAGPGVRFIDPAPAAARQLIKMLDKYGIAYGTEREGRVTLRSSGDPDSARKLLDSITA